jgi:hypothetical protein
MIAADWGIDREEVAAEASSMSYHRYYNTSGRTLAVLYNWDKSTFVA